MRGAVRLFAALVAVLQLALPAAVSVADARLDAQSYTTATRSHVEDQSSTSCPRIHPLECALCQFLSSGTGTPAAAVLPYASRRDISCPAEAVVRRVATAAGALPLSRAPPLS